MPHVKPEDLPSDFGSVSDVPIADILPPGYGDLEPLRRVAMEAAHLAATLATAETGYMRGRIMSVSNMLNAALGRTQSSHGDQYDASGQITKKQDI